MSTWTNEDVTPGSELGQALAALERLQGIAADLSREQRAIERRLEAARATVRAATVESIADDDIALAVALAQVRIPVYEEEFNRLREQAGKAYDSVEYQRQEVSRLQARRRQLIDAFEGRGTVETYDGRRMTADQIERELARLTGATRERSMA